MKKLLLGLVLLSSFAAQAAIVGDVLEATGETVRATGRGAVDIAGAAVGQGPRATERRYQNDNYQYQDNYRYQNDNFVRPTLEDKNLPTRVQDRDFQNFEADRWDE